MGKEKDLEKIKSDPNSVTPDQLKRICKKYGFVSKNGANHDIISHDNLDRSFPIPRHEPIKRIYVKQVIKMIEEIDLDKEK